MKRLTIMLLCCLLLTACASPNAGTTDPTETEPSTAATDPIIMSDPEETELIVPPELNPEGSKFTLYTPNENADGFVSTEVQGELTVLEALIDAGVLTDDIAINSISQEVDSITVDFNAAFADLINAQGSAGERMIIGSVVNTFLSAYEVESVMITVDGQILESGHVAYDFPLEFME